MAYVVNGQTLSVLTNGVKTAFNRGLMNGAVGLNWNRIATEIRSTTTTENYSWLGLAPQFRELIGERHVKNMQQYNYSLVNKTYELTVGIPRTAVEDDQYGVYLPLFEEIGYEASLHKERLVMAALMDGFSVTGYDGVSFFNASHPVGASTASNSGGGSGSAWFLLDASRALKPLILQVRLDNELISKIDARDDNVIWQEEYIYAARNRMVAGYGFWQYAYGSKSTLSSTNFDSAMEAMMGFQSDEGTPLGVRPNVLVCGPSLRSEALSILEAQYLASGASNINYKAVDLIVSPFLT